MTLIGLHRLANALEALCMGLPPAYTQDAYEAFESFDAAMAARERNR